MEYVLINEETGNQVLKGDTVKDFRGDSAIVESYTPPHKPSSTGRVITNEGEYFPSVYGLKIVLIQAGEKGEALLRKLHPITVMQDGATFFTVEDTFFSTADTITGEYWEASNHPIKDYDMEGARVARKEFIQWCDYHGYKLTLR